MFVSTYDYDGTVVCYDGLTHAVQWSLRLSSLSFRGMQLVDLDGDGALELVLSVGIESTGSPAASVYVYDAATGVLKWKSPDLTGTWLRLSLLRVANVDADPAQEILVADQGGRLWIIDANTRTLQLTTADLDITALKTVDINGDGQPEVLIGTASGALQVLDVSTGTASQTLFTTSGAINGLAVLDLNADGVKDYAFASSERLRIVNGVTRTESWSSDVLGTDVGAPDALFAADLNGDNRPEIVVNVGLTGFMVFDVAPGGVLAIYDPSLQAPRCTTPDVSCDSGLLLTGRGLLGPEPNASNTLYGSCEDGNAGTFHLDESNDRIRLVSLDGTPFAPGKTIRIDATVWAWTQATADQLELYTAADANAPEWQYLTTLKPIVAGAQTLSATYVLPTGKLQAVRARLRSLGSAPCGTGTFTDTDDLAFAVHDPQAVWGYRSESPCWRKELGGGERQGGAVLLPSDDEDAPLRQRRGREVAARGAHCRGLRPGARDDIVALDRGGDCSRAAGAAQHQHPARGQHRQGELTARRGQ